MDLKALYYFVVVSEELNFTHAAERLHMSQPPLSSQIKALEEELQVQLFIRGRRKLRLTDAGVQLLRRARQILDLAERTKEEMAAMNAELSGWIRIGMVQGCAPFLAAGLISAFRQEYPLVHFALTSGGSDELIEDMAHGLLDLAVIAAPYDLEHYEGIVIGSEPWVAMMPAGHPLAKAEGGTVSIASLKGEPLIVPQRPSRIEAIRRWFRSAGIEPDIVCTLSNYIPAVSLVERGAGICIFPRTMSVSLPGVVSRIIADPVKKAEYVLTWSKEHALTEQAGEFINLIRDRRESGEDGLAGAAFSGENIFFGGCASDEKWMENAELL